MAQPRSTSGGSALGVLGDPCRGFNAGDALDRSAVLDPRRSLANDPAPQRFASDLQLVSQPGLSLVVVLEPAKEPVPGLGGFCGHDSNR